MNLTMQNVQFIISKPPTLKSTNHSSTPTMSEPWPQPSHRKHRGAQAFSFQEALRISMTQRHQWRLRVALDDAMALAPGFLKDEGILGEKISIGTWLTMINYGDILMVGIDGWVVGW